MYHGNESKESKAVGDQSTVTFSSTSNSPAATVLSGSSSVGGSLLSLLEPTIAISGLFSSKPDTILK